LDGVSVGSGRAAQVMSGAISKQNPLVLASERGDMPGRREIPCKLLLKSVDEFVRPFTVLTSNHLQNQGSHGLQRID
jgi:hypothetical protein